MDINERKYTEDETEKITGLKKRTLQRRRLEGKGPAWLKVGGRSVRYAESDLLTFLQEARKNGGGHNVSHHEGKGASYDHAPGGEGGSR